MFLQNKGFDYINRSSIFYLDNVKTLFLYKLKINETPAVVYSLVKIIKNKIINYNKAVSSIDTNVDIIYATGILECDWQQEK